MKKLQVLILFLSIAWCFGQIPTVPTPEETVATTTTTEAAITTTTSIAITTTRPPASIPTAPTPTLSSETTTTILATTSTSDNLATPPTSPPPESFQCPPVGVYYYPTSHCQHFVVCINGSQQAGRCQDGFLFDAIRLNCEPAYTVNCGDRTRPEGVNSFIFRFWRF